MIKVNILTLKDEKKNQRYAIEFQVSGKDEITTTIILEENEFVEFINAINDFKFKEVL